MCVCGLIMLLVPRRRDLSLSNWPRGNFVAYFTVVRALKVVHQLKFGNVEGDRLVKRKCKLLSGRRKIFQYKILFDILE